MFSKVNQSRLDRPKGLQCFPCVTPSYVACRVHRITRVTTAAGLRTIRMNVQINWASLSNETLEDRRDSKRVHLQFTLEISGTDATGAVFHVSGRTRNVSHRGCCFEVARPIVPGEELELKVVRHTLLGVRESTEALPFRMAWVVQEENLWVAGAEMVQREAPWGIKFPDKPAVAKV
jgi:hypothetical protein